MKVKIYLIQVLRISVIGVKYLYDLYHKQIIPFVKKKLNRIGFSAIKL